MAGSSIDPSYQFVAVTPSDTAVLTYAYGYGTTPVKTKAIYVGGVGDLTILNDAGTAVLFAGVPAGSLLPISTQVIKSTGTTATNIVALF